MSRPGTGQFWSLQRTRGSGIPLAKMLSQTSKPTIAVEDYVASVATLIQELPAPRAVRE